MTTYEEILRHYNGNEELAMRYILKCDPAFRHGIQL